MNRHFFLVSALVLALAVSSAQVGLAQGKKAPEPGDAVEVSDFGEVKVGKVVEVIGNNAIFKVELEDGKIKPFPARNVRIPKNKAAAARKIAEFGSSKGDNAPSAGVVGKSRTWSDKTGKFKIEASFVELKDGKVKLRKEDGKEVSVDLDKLSEADQEIATLSSQVGNKPVADPDNPFQESEGSGSKVASSNEVQGDPDKAAKITLAAPASWSLTPDAPTGPGVKIPAKSIVLPTRPSKDAFFEGPAGMAINSAKGHIWAMIKQGHGKDAAMRVEVVDAVSGDPVTMFQPAKAFTLMGFSPSGETLCALNDDDFFKKNERVEVYKLVDKELAPVVSLRPYKGKDNWGVKVERALLIDDDHLLTMSDGGYVVVWEIPSAKPLWAVQLKDWGAACALSPSGKQVALHDEAGLFFVEALTGKVLGKLDRPATSDHNVRIAFRPEGQLFAYLAGMQLLVWDLQSGKPIVNEPGMHMQHGHTNTLAFGSDGQSLIVDDEYVIDPQRRIVIAKYSGGGASRVQAGELWSIHSEFTRDRQKVHTVVHAPIPSPEIVQKAASASEESLLALKAGAKVSITSNLAFDQATNDRIRTAIIEKIKANGWEHVESGGEAVIETLITAGKPYETEYRGFGLGGSQKVTINPLDGKIDLKLAGKSIWSTGAQWGAPHFIQLKEGETIEQATRAKPSPEFFTGAVIPRRIFAYPKPGALVHARLDNKGLKIE